MTKPNTFRHNQPASVASLRRLFAFTGTPFGFPLESPFIFTGIPTVDKKTQQIEIETYQNPWSLVTLTISNN